MTPILRVLFAALLLSAAFAPERVAIANDVIEHKDKNTVTVYKSPTCGCCVGWIDHLKAAGFQVVAHDSKEMSRIKTERGVPKELGSCHTAEVGGYVIEGHVPPADIQRLLREQPPIAGLAVPGMPIGSPGMEGPNPERYEVIGFGPDGTTAVFTTHTP